MTDENLGSADAKVVGAHGGREPAVRPCPVVHGGLAGLLSSQPAPHPRLLTPTRFGLFGVVTGLSRADGCESRASEDGVVGIGPVLLCRYA